MTKNIDTKALVLFVSILFLLALFALISLNLMHTFASADLGEFVGLCSSSCSTTG